jgi:hypothetical protein
MTVDVDDIDADDAYSIAARDVFWLAVLREQLTSGEPINRDAIARRLGELLENVDLLD